MTALLQFCRAAPPWVIIGTVIFLGIICGLHQRMMAMACRKARRLGMIDGWHACNAAVGIGQMLEAHDNEIEETA